MEKKKQPPHILAVPTSPEHWSDSSKQSYAYQSPPREYSDRHYTCRHCRKAAVFTGQEQREAYEVRKAYIWQARVLCAECFATRMQIEAELLACAHRWQTTRAECNADTPFLRRWHGLLQQHVDYGGSRDEGNTHMLLALLRGREC